METRNPEQTQAAIHIKSKDTTYAREQIENLVKSRPNY